MRFIITFIFWALLSSSAWAIDINQLADAIYKAEGGNKTKHPYGILSVKCKTTQDCRQICINSIKHNLTRFKKNRGATVTPEAFIAFMGARWAPVNATNDPEGLNKHWVKNVLFFYKKLDTQK